MGRQTTVGLSTTAISVAGYLFVNFTDKASVIIQDAQSLVGFLVIPKYVPLNDL